PGGTVAKRPHHRRILDPQLAQDLRGGNLYLRAPRLEDAEDLLYGLVHTCKARGEPVAARLWQTLGGCAKRAGADRGRCWRPGVEDSDAATRFRGTGKRTAALPARGRERQPRRTRRYPVDTSAGARLDANGGSALWSEKPREAVAGAC